MADISKYIPNDDTKNNPFSRLQSMVKTSQNNLTNEYEIGIIKLWGLV